MKCPACTTIIYNDEYSSPSDQAIICRSIRNIPVKTGMCSIISSVSVTVQLLPRNRLIMFINLRKSFHYCNFK